MSLRRSKGQHANRLAETRPAPADDTNPIPNVSIVQDQATLTLPVTTGAAPAPRVLPAPGPASLPPLPSGRHRAAWIPAPAPAPARPPAPIRITEPAALAADIGAAHPGVFTLPCGSCWRVHTRGGTASFQAMYAFAGQAGWRKDTLGAWACPACQAKPGWRAPNTPAMTWECLEYALARNVAARAARVPVLMAFQQAQRFPRYYLNATALGALNVNVLDEEENAA